ncbi:STAS-like domain-containing protein [Candidatus Electrothrix sp.]|uniref:STAS-like domain-containing protein n=1 Tax=Candidatus Electrothrix sp. TaxID=2170559 RepID=UPI004056AC2E
MTTSKSRGEQIRQAILDNLEDSFDSIVPFISDKFDISRQAVNKHMRRLVDEGLIDAIGNTRSRKYLLAENTVLEKCYSINKELAEDVVWRDDIRPTLGELKRNVLDLWNYVFTEMFNNALDHSSGSEIRVSLEETAKSKELRISDNGEGIFKKIQRELNLYDERHAVLELSKGKLTTDPSRHSGEGIFFSSRAVDKFMILSESTYFSHQFERDSDWILETQKKYEGTLVAMVLNNDTQQTLDELFDRFTSGDDYGFTKTVVPVRLAQYEEEYLVSRSQAKRVLTRVDRFQTVVFDFEGVNQIGQAFADEIFRVFANQNPDIDLIHIKTNESVTKMIKRAISRS